MNAKEMNEMRAKKIETSGMTGTEKQIAFALRIKRDMLYDFSELGEVATLKSLDIKLKRFYANKGHKFTTDILEIYKSILENKDSKFWINDARDAGSIKTLIKNMAYEMAEG